MLPSHPADLELRLIDPARNKFRLYGLTEDRTLFGELCLRIQWGRIGNRRVRERTEVFAQPEELEQRRTQLLHLRQRHGYKAVSPHPGATDASTDADQTPRLPTAHARLRAEEAAVVEAHGLPLGDHPVRQLVAQWRDATEAIRLYLAARRAEPLDLVDVSTLAAMYVDAIAS